MVLASGILSKYHIKKRSNFPSGKGGVGKKEEKLILENEIPKISLVSSVEIRIFWGVGGGREPMITCMNLLNDSLKVP